MNWQDAFVTVTLPVSCTNNYYILTGNFYNGHANVNVYITSASTTAFTLHHYGWGNGAWWLTIGD